MKSFKSLCCKAGIIRKGRANYVCSKCGEDNTLYLVLLFDVMKPKEGIKATVNMSKKSTNSVIIKQPLFLIG